MPIYKLNDVRFEYKESLTKNQDGVDKDAERGKLFAAVKENCEVVLTGPKTRKVSKGDVLVMEQSGNEYLCSVLKKKSEGAKK